MVRKSKIIHMVLGFISLATLTFCGKDTLFDCFKGTGKVSTEERQASSFRGIILLNNIDLHLSQGPAYSITVEAGKNLLGKIKTTVKDHVLTIANENSCNWVRSYDSPLNVYVTVVDLDSIIYQSSGNIYSVNTLVTDSLKLYVKEGGGSIDLSIQTWKSRFQLDEGTVDLSVHGYSNVNYVSSKAYGPVDCLDLETGFTYMGTSSTNDCYISVDAELVVVIDNAGNVYYRGDPANIEYTRNGDGQLIKLDQ